MFITQSFQLFKTVNRDTLITFSKGMSE